MTVPSCEDRKDFGQILNESLNEETIVALESSYLRVPFEQSRRAFRNELKAVEKDLAPIYGIVNKEISPDSRAKLLSKVTSIKERVKIMKEESRAYRKRFLSRMEKISNFTEIKEREYMLKWLKERNIRLIGEYLCYQGQLHGADLLKKESIDTNLDVDLDMELFEEMHQIRKRLLEDNDASLAISWCSENRTALKKNDSQLEFMLKRQEFVEMARKGQHGEAIAYAKKQFSTFKAENQREIEQALGLLSMPSDTKCMPYVWLFGGERWVDLADYFLEECLLVNGLPEQPQIVSLVLAGLAALKTHSCSTVKKDGINDCPACGSPLACLAAHLPISHHETSRLVCPVTGDIMDGDHSPIVLPNGHVYSQKAINGMCKEGMVVCPMTKQSYRVTEARKSYIS